MNWDSIVAQQLAAHPGQRLLVLSAEKAILKVAQGDGRGGLQRTCRQGVASLFGVRDAMNPQRRLQYEAERLQTLAAAGILVPAVLAQGPDWLVIEQLQENWLDVFELATSERQASLLISAFTDLGALHATGQWHGGAQLRNLMRKDGQTYRIDFEEIVLQAVSLARRQFFDVLMLLLDAFRYGRSLGNVEAQTGQWLQAYQAAGGPFEPVRRILMWGWYLYWASLPLRPFARWLGRDGRLTLDFLSMLRQHKNVLLHRKGPAAAQ